MKKYFLFLYIIPTILFSQEADIVKNKNLTRIAFGSCSMAHLTDKQLWKEVNKTNPDLWIWLGDNIYGDSEKINVLRENYTLQKLHPDYQQLLVKTEVIGIWDDHDYGVNDGGKEYSSKDESKEELFRFLDVDKNHPAQIRKGVYQSYKYNHKNKSIKIILLDTRYFRDSLKWENAETINKIALVNPKGDILGNLQWSWFENQLSEPDIDLFIVVTGIQVIPEQHRFEKWSNFPKSKAKLMKLIGDKVKSPLIFLTGDRHISEISKENIANHPYPIYEVTSSSLTSPWKVKNLDLNIKRIGKIIYAPNFSLMTIVSKKSSLVIRMTYLGKDNKKLAQHIFKYHN